jgi:hypothetical protein
MEHRTNGIQTGLYAAAGKRFNSKNMTRLPAGARCGGRKYAMTRWEICIIIDGTAMRNKMKNLNMGFEWS